MNIRWSVLKTDVEPTHESNVPQTAAIVQHICGMTNQQLSLFLTLKNQNCAVLCCQRSGCGDLVVTAVRLASIAVRAQQLSGTERSIILLDH
jgi:hypothetical protein